MKALLKGTAEARSALSQTTWWDPLLRSRLLVFGVAVAVVAFVIARIDANIWREQARLHEGFAAIKAEKFYFGVNFRVSLRKLNATLLDFHLKGNPADLGKFREEARQLQSWLESKEQNFVDPREREAFTRLQTVYSAFLTSAQTLLQPGTSKAAGREYFADAYEQLRSDYRPALEACDEVVHAEHGAFDVFLAKSEHSLVTLQRAFLVSLVLLMAFAGALAVIVYRGMFAPLRAKLNESQAMLERQEKLAALGALGAGVAHEIRNPLMAIKFRLFSLKESLPPEFTNNEDARVIGEELSRLDRIVKDFLQFARPSQPELVRVPAQRVLTEVGDLMRSELEPQSIELKVEVKQSAWIQADTQQIKQVLINLVQNSAESIGRQGTITLRLGKDVANIARNKVGWRTSVHRKVRGSAELANVSAAYGGAVQQAQILTTDHCSPPVARHVPVAILAVADTGKGIPLEVQKRLFDPFFTTKEGGTGLGLAIAARIVEQHGGLLRYETQLNRGTIFEIVLPSLEDDVIEDTAH